MKTLIVAEKSSVATDYKNVLEKKHGKFNKGNRCFENDKYVITWARGHLLKSLEPRDYEEFTSREGKGWSLNSIPFYPPNGDLDYIIGDTTQSEFSAVSEVMKRNDIKEFINACDAGREGDLIFWEMYDYLKLKQPVLRLWCKTNTEKGVTEAFDNLKPESFSFPKRDAAYARAYADWVLGMNLTIGFSVKANRGEALHVGRVQTPTIAILAKRREEIENFVSKDYYEVQAEFGGKYKGQWFKEQLSNTKFDKKEDAELIVAKISGKEGKVVKKEIKEETKPHPLLYSLTTLQQDANKKFGLTASETLKIAQSLYETHKILSYPRTDSQHLGEDQVAILEPTLEAVKIDQYKDFVEEITSKPIKTSKRFMDDKKLTDHHALIPTEKTPDLNALNLNEKNVYDLVVKRFLSVFYPSAKYEKTDIVTEVEGETFKTSGKIEIDAGWKVVYGNDDGEEDDKKKEEKLPMIEKDETNIISSSKMDSKKTKPPKHYTEADLLEAMNNPKKFLHSEELKDALTESEAGLGTPATRDAAIEGIINKGYVERQKKNLVATDLGMKLIQVCPEELKSPEITAEWEKKLNEISLGKREKEDFKKEIQEYIEHNIEILRTSELKVQFERKNNGGVKIGVCPECGTDVMKKEINAKMSNGKTRKMTMYSCANSSKENRCFVAFDEIAGKKISDKHIKQLLTQKVTDEIKGFKSKTKKEFSAKLKFQDKKISFDFPEQKNEETNIPCPVCNQNVFDKGNSVACPDGHVVVYKNIAKKEISMSDIEKLLKTGSTDQIDKFKSKANKDFSAKLVLKDGKVEFSFEGVQSQQKTTGIKCPVCDGGELNELAWGYGCSNFKNGCKFSVSKEMFGKKISLSVIKEVLKNKKTSKKVEGFKSKNGKEYSAFLVLDENTKKIKISFE